MKLVIFGIVLMIWNYVISGQDIVFPDDEQISHVSGNSAMVIILEYYSIKIKVSIKRNMFNFCYR